MKKVIIFLMLWTSFSLAIISDCMEFNATGKCDHCLIMNFEK